MDVRDTSNDQYDGDNLTPSTNDAAITSATALLLKMNLHNCLIIIILEERIEFDCMRRCLLLVSTMLWLWRGAM